MAPYESPGVGLSYPHNMPQENMPQVVRSQKNGPPSTTRSCGKTCFSRGKVAQLLQIPLVCVQNDVLFAFYIF